MVSSNMGLCYYGLGQMEVAFNCVNEALALDPDFRDARTLCIKIEELIDGGP
jgi:tetratricopeptide (TPR) repeat protein